MYLKNCRDFNESLQKRTENLLEKMIVNLPKNYRKFTEIITAVSP